MDAVAYVLRCFEDGDVTHVENRIDPIADAETVETELCSPISRAWKNAARKSKRRPRPATRNSKAQFAVIEKALVMLREGKPARLASITHEEMPIFRALQLLTSKPVLYVCNVDEASAAAGNAFSKSVEARAKSEGAESAPSRPRSRASSLASRRRIATRSLPKWA